MRVFILSVVTADGFIARNSGQISLEWTSREDKVLFMRLTKEAGVVVMGSTTFATFNRALPGRRLIIYTHHPETITTEGVETTTESPKQLMARLADESATSVAICGGSQIYSQFMEAGVVDEIYLTIEPVLFGSGIPMFSKPLEQNLTLLESSQLNANTMLLHYQVAK